MARTRQQELAFLLTGRDVSASRAMGGAKRQIQSLEKIAGKAGTNAARNLERGILLGTTAAVGAIGYAIKTAQDFESATAGVAKTVDGDITTIVDGLKEISTTSPVAYEELAGIAEAAGALGVAKDDIVDFTDVVAKLSVTTDLTSEAASTSLGHLKTNLKLVGDDFEHVGNTLVDLGNKGASTESQILGMAEGVSGVAGIVNLSTPQVLGWGAAWANTGEEIEAGSTELQKFFLETFGMVNKGGSKLETLAKIAGTTSKKFAAAYRADASAAMADFLVKLGKLDEAEQAATLESLGFTDQRITRGLLKILGNTKNLTDSLNVASTAWGENNAMTKEAEKRFATSASQMKILENNFRLAAATIGTELLPIVNELAQEGVDWIQEHQPEIKQFGKDLAEGIRDAVGWAKSLDWDAIATALKTGAGAAAGLVEAFTKLPPWAQELLAGGFVLNKFTGGAVTDLLKFTLRSMAVQAGVVHVTGGVVNAGMGGGVNTGPGGFLGGAGNAASRLLRVGGGLALGFGASQLLQAAPSLGATPQGFGAGIAGGAGMALGGAAIAGPLGAIAGSLLAVAQTQQVQSDASTALAQSVQATQQASAAQNDLSVADLTTQLAAIDQGIADMRANPLLAIVQGDALTTLQQMRDDVAAQLAATQRASGDLSPDARQEAADAMVQKQAEALEAFRASERATGRAAADQKYIAAGAARQAAEQRMATNRVYDAIERARAAITSMPPPTVKVTVNNHNTITGRTTTNTQDYDNRVSSTDWQIVAR